MIVLKDLAQEYDIHPSALRTILRGLFGKRQGRWRWESEQDKQLKQIREHLSQRQAA